MYCEHWVYRFFPSCRSALVAAKTRRSSFPAGQPFHAFSGCSLQLPDRLAALAAVCFWPPCGTLFPLLALAFQ